MASFTVSTIVLAVIAYYDLRPKWQAEYRRVFWVSAAFLLAGYVILVLTSFNVNLPSPVRPMSDLVSWLTGKNL